MPDSNVTRESLAKGDEEAFADAYRNYFPSVRAFLQVWLGSPEASDDLAQDTFLQLWRQPDRFDPGRSNLKTYLLGIARKKAADWWRRLPAGMQHASAPPISTTGETVPAVQQLLAKLPPDLRDILWLREAEGYSYEELARLLHIPVGTVKSRLSAAREQMRQFWNTKEANV